MWVHLLGITGGGAIGSSVVAMLVSETVLVSDTFPIVVIPLFFFGVVSIFVSFIFANKG